MNKVYYGTLESLEDSFNSCPQLSHDLCEPFFIDPKLATDSCIQRMIDAKQRLEDFMSNEVNDGVAIFDMETVINTCRVCGCCHSYKIKPASEQEFISELIRELGVNIPCERIKIRQSRFYQDTLKILQQGSYRVRDAVRAIFESHPSVGEYSIDVFGFRKEFCVLTIMESFLSITEEFVKYI